MAIEVFDGNTADPKTLAAQIAKLKTRFRLSRVGLVGRSGHAHQCADRDRTAPGRNWIGSARCAPRRSRPWSRAGRCSCRCSTSRTWSRSPTRTTPASGWCAAATRPWPSERARKRDELLAATENELDKIAAATRRDTGHCAGATRSPCGWARCATTTRWPNTLTSRSPTRHSPSPASRTRIAAEAALDGIYVLRTSLPEQTLERDDVVLRYKDLADVERFFRTLNTELDVRPIRHRLADRVRAHMFLRMLSYYISWHMKQHLAPILFHDNDKPAAAAKRTDPVAAAQRSNTALAKASRKRTHDDYPVHSFTSLLADLATICANQIQPTDDMPAFTMITTPTPLQHRAFELLGVSHRHGLA